MLLTGPEPPPGVSPSGELDGLQVALACVHRLQDTLAGNHADNATRRAAAPAREQSLRVLSARLG